MNNVFNYLNYVFLSSRIGSIYKKIYYDNMFYITYGIHNISWNNKTFFDLIYKLKYYLDIPSECVIISVIYMKRLVIKELEITEFNIRNIFVVCICIAYKFLIDYSLSFNVYSKITSIPIKYLSKMELYLLRILEYKIFVDYELYEQTLFMISES